VGAGVNKINNNLSGGGLVLVLMKILKNLETTNMPQNIENFESLKTGHLCVLVSILNFPVLHFDWCLEGSFRYPDRRKQMEAVATRDVIPYCTVLYVVPGGWWYYDHSW